MRIVIYNDITVRKLAEDDAHLLVKWLSDPRVLQYYEGRDRPHDLDMVRRHFYDRTREVTSCVVECDSLAIGYIQYYLITEKERQLYGFNDFVGAIYGMDQFIGEVTYWNKGIGTVLVQSMVDFLLTKQKADKIVMDPQTWDTRALHVYEKCGFVRKKLLPEHEWHEGQYRDCWVVVYEADENSFVKSGKRRESKE
ncbi:GNAT family N-acetyltransferase [Numidum massiliense]|uniref:GNAT family N-acetyltransferase n=1 Tax=Numidum massiliense TaxID=1522315 RepID=UPI0006D586BF|nr:GNAT family N-acetyltransferase [Numidum massiliense]